MLYYLTNSLIIDKTKKEFQNICKSVRNLAISAYESKHFVTGDFQVIEYFADIFELPAKYTAPGIICNLLLGLKAPEQCKCEKTIYEKEKNWYYSISEYSA